MNNEWYRYISDAYMQHPVCTDASFQTTNPANLAKKVNLNPVIATPVILFIIIFTWTGMTLRSFRQAILRSLPLDQDCVAPPIVGSLFTLFVWAAAYKYLSQQTNPYLALELQYLPHFMALATVACYAWHIVHILKLAGTKRFRRIHLSDQGPLQQASRQKAPAQIIQFPGPNNPPGARKRA